jgi:hypothetical protein
VNGLLGHIARFWRRVRIGRNPLARPWDRIEGALLTTLVAGVVLALPLAAYVGSSNYADQMAISAREKLSRHSATAKVLMDAPPPALISEGVGVVNDNSTVAAQWVLSSGTVRTGDIPVPSGSLAGQTVPIWLTDTGEQAPAPRTRADAVTAGVFTGAFTWLGVTLLLAALYRGGCVILDRRRAAQWDRDWTNVAEQWTAS